MIDVTDVSSHTEATVRVKLTGAPELPASYLSRDIQPDHVSIKFVFGPGQHRGWWVAADVSVSGQRVLKAGPDGQQRLGKERHTAHWYGGRTRDVQTDRDLPEWLDNLVSELRPSGQVTLPGGA
jgi:hypothetical protein